MSDAEAELARIRALNVARSQRWRDRHPGRRQAYMKKLRAARTKLRANHPDEWAKYAAKEREAGATASQSYDRAHSQLAKAHPQEWRDLLATTT